MNMEVWLHSIYWREPFWFLLALQPLILLFIRHLSRKKKLACYADADLQAWVSWQQTRQAGSFFSWISSRQTLYVIAWLLLATALAGPRLLLEKPASNDEPDLNIMLVVDVSRSMQARDIKPGRLRRVQIEINELLQRTANNRIGIILYTARAHLFVPFTNDVKALKYYLRMIDNIPMPTSGSSPAAALELARKEIKQADFDNKSAILWFTDGDFSDDNADTVKELLTTVNKLASSSIPLYILGLGSPEGEAVPLSDGGWLEFQGRPVISRMDEKLLSVLADKGKGNYIAAQTDDSDWHSLYELGMGADTYLANKTIIDDEVVWQELYPWVLFPAIVLLFICLMPYRLSRFKPASTLAHSYLLLISLLASLPVSHQAQAVENTLPIIEIERQAYHYFNVENYTQAAEFYRHVAGYNGRLGEGNSYYRMDEYSNAIRQFNQAVLLAKTDPQRGTAIYNLANATFKTGDYNLASSLFRDVLLYQPSHEASKKNLAISNALQQLIEKQMQQGTASRMGSGPRSARAQQGLDINSSGSMSFDNEQERKESDIPLPDIPDEKLKELLARGLAYVHLASEKLQNSDKIKQHKVTPQQDINAARLRMRELEDRQRLLWKRMFEMEEGFAAPLEEAERVPGIRPW